VPQGSVLFKEVISVGPCSQEQLRKEGDGRLQNVLSLVTRNRVFFFQADTPEVWIYLFIFFSSYIYGGNDVCLRESHVN